LVRLSTLALPPNSRGRVVPIAVALAVLCLLVASGVWLVSRPSPQSTLAAPTAAHVEQTLRAPPSTTVTTLDTSTVPETVPPTTEPPTTAPPVTQPPGPDPAVLATKQIQGQLRDLGYSPGSVDGKFGGRTTSTGSNEPFTWPDGTPAKAYTPTGHFSVLRRVEGVDDGPLGALYRPLYFYDGWAVHGASYVPAFPASHGCARVSFADQDWIWDNIPDGTPVIVY
jgi:lipoprotein-anchoring transpeptidase ErfK/SrfK